MLTTFSEFLRKLRITMSFMMTMHGSEDFHKTGAPGQSTQGIAQSGKSSTKLLC